MEIKVDYFLNIFLPRFQQIKEVHGLELTFELIKRLVTFDDFKYESR
jgi:hypothetical protein